MINSQLRTTQLDSAPLASLSLPDAVNAIPGICHLQTEPKIWSSPTIVSAWRQMHESMQELRRSDVSRAQEVERKDLKGLAWCTAHAEIQYLLNIFAPTIRDKIMSSADFSTATVEEFYMHVGHDIEVRGDDWLVRLPPPDFEDIQYSLRKLGKFGEDGRGCIESTAHRVSAWRGRHGEILGITVRVGRYVPNAAKALLSLAREKSLLILSRAGLGKTTLLRDLAASIANSPTSPRVAVVDTSNEIGGDGPIPMPFLGRCRRIQVPKRELQCQVMAEAVQNHTPEYLIIDEIVSAAEAQAAWSISQRGVRLIATCHGETLEGLLQNQDLKLLVGGTAHAFLSNEERRLRNKEKKTVLERPYSSPFDVVVEIHRRNKAFAYVNVNKAVDLILDDKKPKHHALVGDFIDLLEPLPARLEQLMASQKAEGAKESKPHQGEGKQNGSPPLRGNKKNQKNKSDADLYKELSDFL